MANLTGRQVGRAVFYEPAFLETSGDEEQDARRCPAGRRREPPLVWQGERAYRYRRDFFDGRRGSREGSLIGELSSDPEMMLW